MRSHHKVRQRHHAQIFQPRCLLLVTREEWKVWKWEKGGMYQKRLRNQLVHIVFRCRQIDINFVVSYHSRKRSSVLGDVRFWFCPNLITFAQLSLQFCPNLLKSNQFCSKNCARGCGAEDAVASSVLPAPTALFRTLDPGPALRGARPPNFGGLALLLLTIRITNTNLKGY